MQGTTGAPRQRSWGIEPIQQDQDSQVTLDLEGLTGTLVSVDYSIWRRSESAAAWTAPTGTSYTVSIPLGVTSSLDLGTDYEGRWSVKTSTGTFTFRQPTAVVRQPLRCPVTEDDIYGLHPEWVAFASKQVSGETDFVWAVAASWRRVQGRLLKDGRYPHLITDAWALYEATLYGALEIAARSFSSGEREEGRWTKLAAHYAGLAEDALAGAPLKYDTDDDGNPDTLLAGAPVLHLTAWKGV